MKKRARVSKWLKTKSLIIQTFPHGYCKLLKKMVAYSKIEWLLFYEFTLFFIFTFFSTMLHTEVKLDFSVLTMSWVGIIRIWRHWFTLPSNSTIQYITWYNDCLCCCGIGLKSNTMVYVQLCGFELMTFRHNYVVPK